MLTQGNNPWIDDIAYNAKWGSSSLVPTKVDIKILQPKDQKLYDLNGLAWYESTARIGEWIQDGNPIGKIAKDYRRTIFIGYDNADIPC